MATVWAMRIHHAIAVAAAVALTSSVAGIAHADPPAPAPPQQPAHDGVSARDVVAYTALGLGAAALVFGVAETIHWYSAYEDGHNLQSQVSSSNVDACTNQVTPAAAALCRDSKDVSASYPLALIGYGAAAALGTTGLVLLLTRPHDTTSNNAGHVDVAPSVSQRSAGLQLRLTF
jgi:hypothetical protein